MSNKNIFNFQKQDNCNICEDGKIPPCFISRVRILPGLSIYLCNYVAEYSSDYSFTFLDILFDFFVRCLECIGLPFSGAFPPYSPSVYLSVNQNWAVLLGTDTCGPNTFRQLWLILHTTTHNLLIWYSIARQRKCIHKGQVEWGERKTCSSVSYIYVRSEKGLDAP